MLRYVDHVDKDLDDLQQTLETIANFTKETEEKVVFMKESTTSLQKSVQPGNTLHLVPLNIVLRPVF